MKAYGIIGWVGDAELLCPDCARALGFDGDEGTPVFAYDANEGEYCAACLGAWIASTEPNQRRNGCPDYIYLEGCAPAKGNEITIANLPECKKVAGWT